MRETIQTRNIGQLEPSKGVQRVLSFRYQDVGQETPMCGDV